MPALLPKLTNRKPAKPSASGEAGVDHRRLLEQAEVASVESSELSLRGPGTYAPGPRPQPNGLFRDGSEAPAATRGKFGGVHHAVSAAGLRGHHGDVGGVDQRLRRGRVVRERRDGC